MIHLAQRPGVRGASTGLDTERDGLGVGLYHNLLPYLF